MYQQPIYNAMIALCDNLNVMLSNTTRKPVCWIILQRAWGDIANAACSFIIIDGP